MTDTTPPTTSDATEATASSETSADAPAGAALTGGGRAALTDGGTAGGEGDGLDVLVVGVDAACRPVLDPLFEAGRLPTLADLFDGGASGPLESQIPPWTASAWPSLYTGVNPGKHGVFGFLTYEGYDWDVVNATHVRAPTLWEVADEHGLTSVVVNAPVTHPPPAVDGAVLPGYTAPERPDCHPPGLLADVREAVGDYRVYADPEWEAPGKYRRLVEMRGAAFRYLADRFDPDFGFVQFQQTDTVFHETGGDPDAVGVAYEAVDEAVADVLAACDPATVLVVSDHGMGEYRGYEFRANEFLRERGDVAVTRGGGGMPAWMPILDDRLREGRASDEDDAGASALSRTVALAARVGVTPGRVGRVLRALGLQEVVSRHLPARAVRAGDRQVDFPASRAYVRSRVELGVRINLAGREPAGVVPEAEYEALREELVEALSAVRTPEGDPVFDDVAPREDYFEGPHCADAPDVVCVPAAFDQFLSADLKGEQFGEPPEPYNHKLEGVVAATGAGVDADADLSGAHLFDVAPTVLAALGLPRGARMDGEALPVVDAATGERTYETPERARTGTDDAGVERRLADLGYLEGGE